MAETIEMLALAPTLAPLLSGAGHALSARAAFERISTLGFRWLQLSATLEGFRPRDLDRSARRDLLASLRRHELVPAGLDCWIPPAHFADPTTLDRAVGALLAAVQLAADLGRIPVSLSLPESSGSIQGSEVDMRHSVAIDLAAAADRAGVRIADHALPIGAVSGPIGLGIDAAALLSRSIDPAHVVSSRSRELVSARLSDLNRDGMRIAPGAPVDGRLDLLSYRVALSLAGLRQPVVLDARQWDRPWHGIETAKQAWEALA